MTPPVEVTARIPDCWGLRWQPVGGGLSGATVWRGDADTGPYVALKQHPLGYSARRLGWVHFHMSNVHAAWMPRIHCTGDCVCEVEADGRVWGCLDWMPGGPVEPTAATTTAACQALAAMHRVWVRQSSQTGPPPCIARRRSVYADVAPLLDFPPRHLYEAATALQRAIPAATAALAPFDVPGPVQPCLCDPRPEHFLFTGDQLTGVIDFAAMKPDHPAVDLARLLGETGFLDAGVAAYRAAGGSRAVTPGLVRVLADTGRVGAVANWLLRLADRPPTAAEADRLERLLRPLVH